MNNPRIFIAEDEDELRFSLKCIMESKGYEVSEARNGKDALKMIMESFKNSKLYDLLLCDIEMPELNGVELISIIKEKKIDIPILVMTGYGDKELVIKLMRYGCQDFLDKPFKIEVFEERVNTIMNKIARKREQIQNQKSEHVENRKFATIGKKTTTIVHDLNNKLGSVYGYYDLLEENLENKKNQQAQEYCNKMKKSYKQTIKLINDILSIASQKKLTSFPMFKIDIRKIVESILSLAGFNARVELIMDSDIIIEGNSKKLESALWNIIANANDAIADRKDGTVTISNLVAENSILIAISDNGCGIDKEVQEKLFKPGFTHGKENGNGFGLYGAKEIVEAHNGKIWFKSKKQKGTCFYIELPTKQ